MNKVACVTGAISGIGLGIAQALAKEGFTIAVVDLRSEADATAILQEFPGQGHAYIQADISKNEDRVRICESVKQRFGRLDVLVNNAGVAPIERRDIMELGEESYDRVLSINLKGTFFLTQILSNYMRELVENKSIEQPMIISISSMSAYTSSTARGEYCISKAGISMMTKLFADRLAEYGINVYEIRPGIIKTPMTEKVQQKYDQLINEQQLLPIKRWGFPEDIAKAVCAIAKGSFPYSTGEVFNIDGGFHLRRL